MRKRSLLNISGTVGLLLTFTYFVAWTPIVRSNCRSDAARFATEYIQNPITDDQVQSVSLRYSLQYLVCVNKYGVAE